MGHRGASLVGWEARRCAMQRHEPRGSSDYVYDSLYLRWIITFHYNTSQIDDNDRPAQCPAGAQVCAEEVSLTSMHDGYN